MKVSFYLLFVVLFHLSKHNYAQYQDALANYLIDDSDISVANYNLIKTVNNQSFTVYTLNVTSLRWFNGNALTLRIYVSIFNCKCNYNSDVLSDFFKFADLVAHSLCHCSEEHQLYTIELLFYELRYKCAV